MRRTPLLLARVALAALLGASVAVAVTVPAGAALPAPKPPVAFRTAPDAPSRYLGQLTCDPNEKPGAAALRALLKATYGVANAGGTSRGCSTGGKSEHKEGRSYDWMMDVGDPAEKAKADAFTAWLTGPDSQGVAGGNARRLGVMYVIWNKRTWQSWTGQWKAYTGSSPHTDHVHTSLSWDGAFKRTSWWTGSAVTKPDYGPCALYVGEPAPRYTQPRYTPCPAPVPRVDGIISGDWDGDGTDDIGTFDAGQWALEVGGRTVSFRFGAAGDLPVAGDWDQDGRTDIGVMRRGAWYLRDEPSAGPVWRSFNFGRAGDVPLVGTWNGSTLGIGVERDAQWFLRSGLSGGSANVTVSWARSTDRPLVGDWDGDGADSIGVFRGGTWYLANSVHAPAAGVIAFGFGRATDVPLVGDWDGDGADTGGVVRLGDFFWRDDFAGGVGTGSAKVPF